ncbi:2-dehydro-3-deoxygluconokinase [Aureimonas endophytica]|uniref:2-dehydro-3-deoxygluconokinase n=1 Tax=Aureimonas endophytica TaxID=2027858 RepID=A0A916ZIQ9_9HYPH|nr:sugar kinase [Aureimonas endophytica]GGE00007.1 2-dehydro-3-deoxygluconokinase [Aureimonas endophytica]
MAEAGFMAMRGSGAGGRVLAIGECMIELALGADGLYRKGFAGDTFNTAWYLRRLLPAAFDVAYLSGVGDDAESQAMLAFMAGAGIDTGFVRRVPRRMPGLYMIRLDGAERSFTYWRDTSAAKELAADPAHLEAAIDAADALYFSGITLAILSPAHREALLARLGRAKADGRIVAFDPNIRPRLWADKAEMCAAIEAGARAASLSLPSFADEAEAFGDASPEETAERYLALGAAEVVVKDGGGPALVAAGRTRLAVAARQVEDAVDTTGAGDSFSAAYLAARLCGREPADAARSAHGLAGEVVRHRGALVEGIETIAAIV